jgi:hypothetical protein
MKVAELIRLASATAVAAALAAAAHADIKLDGNDYIITCHSGDSTTSPASLGYAHAWQTAEDFCGGDGNFIVSEPTIVATTDSKPDKAAASKGGVSGLLSNIGMGNPPVNKAVDGGGGPLGSIVMGNPPVNKAVDTGGLVTKPLDRAKQEAATDGGKSPAGGSEQTPAPAAQ